jgi:hypothetical protein
MVPDAPPTALVPTSPREDDALVPVPIFGAAQMALAFRAYRELQHVLDEAMPDQIMRAGEKQYRKKGYWRAVAKAFKLRMRCVRERRIADGLFDDGRKNFGYVVVYSATAPDGHSEIGDGACFAVEKAEKFRCPHPEREGSTRSLHFPHEYCPDFDPEFKWRALPSQASVHNVRAHAHTRAFNRAVSNLVGFGEVSAEEVDSDDDAARASGSSSPRPAPRATHGATAKISEPQRRRLYAIGTNAGWTEPEIKALLVRHGFEHAADVTRDKYDAICKELEEGSGS